MTELVKYDAACRAVADAKTIDEAKAIHDEFKARQAYARQAKNRELEADCVEIRLRATRRLSELIDKQRETVGLNVGTRGSRERGARVSEKPTLADAGIDKNLAHQARAFGKLSDAEFERTVTDGRDAVNPPVRKLVRAKIIEPEPEPYRASISRGLATKPKHSPVPPETSGMAAIVRVFGKSQDLGGKPVSVRQIAMKLNGVAPTFVAGLPGRLASTTVDGFRAELIDGFGNDAIWRIMPADEAEALPDVGAAEPGAPSPPRKPEPTELELMAAQMVSCFQQLRANCFKVTPACVFESLSGTEASNLRSDMSVVMTWVCGAGIEPLRDTMSAQEAADLAPPTSSPAELEDADLPDFLKGNSAAGVPEAEPTS